MTQSILAADIGGTNARFAAFALDDAGGLSLEAATWLPTAEAAGLAGLIDGLAATDFPLAPTAADTLVFGIAGPVELGRSSQPPNIPWDVDLDGPEFADRPWAAKARLINDFVAQAFATRSPAADSAAQILPGQAKPGGAVAVVGAGTGLGHCALIPLEDGTWRPAPSEAGHAEFPFVTDKEFAYRDFLTRELERANVIGDMVVSGGGLSQLHRFLTGQDLDPHEVAATLRSDGTEEKNRTLRWFSRFYARACRNYCLSVVGAGGLFIAGGVAAQNPILVSYPTFAAEFHASETHKRLLLDIPVRLMTDRDSGLWGAAAYGRQLLTGGSC